MISIIIPMLNEEKIITQTLTHTQRLPGTCEIIVADGGSIDKTIQLARNFTNVSIINSPPGRAQQMNAGAAQARGEWLLFLHADTRLPLTALTQISSLTTEIQAGGFLHKFSGDDWRLKMISYLDNRRCRKSRIIFGDQAMFIKRNLFEQIGGFPQQEILEDVAICQIINQVTTPVLIEQPAVTDSRRFKQAGIFKSFVRVAAILTRLKFGMDVSPQHPFFKQAR